MIQVASYEREALLDMTLQIQGHMLCDKGYFGKIFTQEMKDQNILMHPPIRHNTKETRPKSFVKSIMNKRRYVETVLRKLIDQISLVDHKPHEALNLARLVYVIF